jgi:DNA-binding transcriptional LysR family regulator
MVGRRVALMEQVTAASPAYLEQFGEPETLEALGAHRAVNYLSSGSGRVLPMEFTVDGRVIEIQLAAVVSVTGADLYTGSAVAGLGLVQVPRYRVTGELSAGTLKVVLEDFPPPAMPVSVLYPQNRQLSARVRVFAQWVREIFEAAGKV